MEMTDRRFLNITIVLLLIAVNAALDASSDWVHSFLEPSLTLRAIVLDWMGIVALALLFGAPLIMLLWNRLIVPTFSLKPITYFKALVLMAIGSWIGGWQVRGLEDRGCG
jgi:hypothetical protein